MSKHKIVLENVIGDTLDTDGLAHYAHRDSEIDDYIYVYSVDKDYLPLLTFSLVEAIYFAGWIMEIAKEATDDLSDTCNKIEDYYDYYPKNDASIK
jgi:hypothetical protein